MNRVEFLAELENLLQDIPEEERQEAQSFYQNYFDDAGPENEQRVMEELESPEKVAESIRQGCFGAEETQSQEQMEETGEMHSQNQKEHKIGESFYNQHKALSIVIIVVIVLALISAWTTSFGGVFGVIIGILGLFIGIAFGTAGAAFGCIVAGVGLLIAGIAALFSSITLGLVLMGCGLLVLVLGILFMILCILFCGKFLPWLWRNCKKLWDSMFQKKEVTA